MNKKENTQVRKFIGFMTRDQILFGKYDILINDAYLSSIFVLQALDFLSWCSTLRFDSDNPEN